MIRQLYYYRFDWTDQKTLQAASDGQIDKPETLGVRCCRCYAFRCKLEIRSCDPGEVSDGCALAVYQTLSLYRVSMLFVFAINIDIDIGMHPLNFSLIYGLFPARLCTLPIFPGFCFGVIVFALFSLSFVVFALFFIFCFYALVRAL